VCVLDGVHITQKIGHEVVRSGTQEKQGAVAHYPVSYIPRCQTNEDC
jgi:hypothetical protein